MTSFSYQLKTRLLIIIATTHFFWNTVYFVYLFSNVGLAVLIKHYCQLCKHQLKIIIMSKKISWIMPDQNLMMEKSRWYDGNIYFMSERSISSVITSPLKLPTYSPNWQSYGNHIDNMNPVSQQKRDIHSMLGECWVSVADGEPTFNQHWVNTSCLLHVGQGSFNLWFRLTTT